ncbi:MAG TPA: ABC transporter permease [Anaerolineae bacterium]|nr:ABC transporter permease [Anaerolineae bacterium]
MLGYILRRILMMIPTLLIISILSFIIIQLPPGDFLTTYAAQLSEMGDAMDQEALEALGERYGLGQPVYVQYYKWMSGIFLRGDWGQSMEWHKPVKELIWERLGLTVMLSLVSLLVSWFVAIPVGVYSATHQYSIPDYLMSVLSFIGAGTPGFMIALVIMWLAMTKIGLNVGGLFSQEYMMAPWSWEKVVDLIKHIWIPVLVIALGSTAQSVRTTRANLLDELNKPYVETARAKGLTEGRLIWKYPVRVAMNPFFSTVGWSLASLISGQTLIAVVLSLQTTGPLLLRALMSQDMYLAGSLLLLISVLTVIGTLISDILLAVVDPRIRLEG